MAEHKLKFSSDTIPYCENSEVLQIPQTNRTFAISNNALYEIDFTTKPQPTIKKSNDKAYPVGCNRMLYVESLDEDQTAIILKVKEGIRIYVHNTNGTLYLASEDDQFHDVYDWNKPENQIFFGHFYDDPNTLGMMATHEKYKTKFSAIFKDPLLSGEFPVYPLVTNLGILDERSPKSVARAIAGLKRFSSKGHVMSRNSAGLSFFQFNASNEIEFVRDVPVLGFESNVDDKIFLVDLTHQDYSDIVHFNSSGMFIYGFQSTDNKYQFIYYNPMFSKERGWTMDHSKTIRFADITDDGSKDMIFTGPKGIAALKYDKYENQWGPILTTVDLPPKKRHARVMQVVGNPDDGYHIITHLDQKIHWARVESTLLPPEPPAIDETTSISPTVVKKSLTPPEKHFIKSIESGPLLRDMDIWSSTLNCVNERTGKPKFSIPLVNLPEPAPKLVLNYDAVDSTSSILGTGWSMALNFIAIDDYQSVFEDDIVGIIVFQDQPLALRFLSSESTSTVRVYTLLSGKKDQKFRAKFYTNNDQWIVDLGNGVQQFYGQIDVTPTVGAVYKKVVWKNWHGPGFDGDNQLEQSRMWYLAKVENAHGQTLLQFSYNTITGKTNSGLTYTKAIYLTGSRDCHGTSIEFNYANKDPSEYKVFEEKDRQGNYNWEPVQSQYLTGYTLTTSTFRQEIHFKYDVRKGHRFLEEIRQTNDVVDNYVAKFEYSTFPRDKFGMERIFLPRDVQVNFSYSPVGHSNPSAKLKRLNVFSDYKVTTGGDFILISFVDKEDSKPGQVVLRMFNSEMTKELYSSDSRARETTKGRWPLLGDHNSVISHNIITGEDFFGVELFYKTSKQLYLFGRKKGSSEWVNEFDSIRLGELAMIEAGTNFVLIADPGAKVDLIEWNTDDAVWKRQAISTEARNTIISVYQNKFVTYNNNVISFGYKSRDGSWQHKPLSHRPLGNCVTESDSAFKRMGFEEKDLKVYTGAFRSNALKLSHNLVALNCLRVNGNRAQTSLHVFAIDRFKNVVNYKRIQIDQDNVDSIKPQDIKLHKYVMSFRGKTVTLHDQKMTFGGSKWNHTILTDDELDEQREQFSVPLGDKYLLEKVDKNSKVKLLDAKTRSTLSQLTLNGSDLRVFFPIYIAVPLEKSGVRLVKFTEPPIERIYNSEKLSPYSNSQLLVTEEGDKSKTVIIRQQNGAKSVAPNYAVQKVTVTFDSDQRKRETGYKFYPEDSMLSGSTVMYTKYAIIPGNDKNSYGWIDRTTSDDGTAVYDGNGEKIPYYPKKRDREANDGDEDEEEKAFRKETTIYDKTGILEIASCAPYRLSEETVGYFGFEDYEINKIGTSSQWTFDASNIIRNSFALTGSNYLHQKLEPVEGVFKPRYQNMEYLASTWVRLHNVTEVPRVGEITPHLKAIVFNSTNDVITSLLSEVKYTMDDWVYLELVVDLPLARQTMNTTANRQGEDLQIAVRVGPTLTRPIDIDHIRFAPLISPFSVNVFDPRTNLEAAVIDKSGSISRKLYDAYSNKVAVINDENQIEELTVYTKTTADTIRPYCTVKVVPDMGIYEQFSPFSFTSRWKITQRHPWSISPYQLRHEGTEVSTMSLNARDISSDSYGFRVLYYLESEATLSVNDIVELSSKPNDGCILEVVESNARHQVPATGEMLFLKENHRFILWINGAVYIDQTSNKIRDKTLTFSMRGKTTVEDLLLFSKPSVKIIYQNSLKEPTQEIYMESNTFAIVNEKLYDNLGRQRITLQNVHVPRPDSQPLLSYISNFITNDAPEQSKNSIWKSGLVAGLATDLLGHPYGFSETQYENNPLNQKSLVTLLGKAFSAPGPFAKRYSSKTANQFLINYFPQQQNVTFQVELKTNGVKDITVLNSRNRKIAQYTSVHNGRDHFSTYKLNDNGNVLQKLPPLYFEKVGTFHKTNAELLDVPEEDLTLQRKIGTHIDYDLDGNVVRKTTADSGPQENIYDSEKRLRFIIRYSFTNPTVIETISYFSYDPIGRVLSTGQILDITIPKQELLNLKLNSKNSRVYQSFDYGNFEKDPNLRGRLLRTITMNGAEPFGEVTYANKIGDTLEKRIVVPTAHNKPLEIIVGKNYLSGGRLQQLNYPVKHLGKHLQIVYTYDRLGHVKSIGTPEDPNKFLMLTYDAEGQVKEELYEPTSVNKFKQTRRYNEPGFLTSLENPFQAEEIAYTKSSYGGLSPGDGSITRVKFSAKWHDTAASFEGTDAVQLNSESFINDVVTPKDSAVCFEALKNAGYVNEKNRQAKVFYPELEISLPIVCTSGTGGRHISNVLGRYGYPHEHGYRFDYGTYQDLIRGKYFVGDDEPTPLQPDVFDKEIPGVNAETSQRIWSALKSGQFLIEDPDPINPLKSHGKKSSKEFIGSNLFYDLRAINTEYAAYLEPLRKLLTSCFIKRQCDKITLPQMQDYISKWLRNSKASFVQRTGADIFEMLRKKRYFANPLDFEFQEVLEEFKHLFPAIVRVLFTHFGRQLGRAEFDVESYEIDSNGNHRIFNTGFSHYRLKYEDNTNRIQDVQYLAFDFPRPVRLFSMQHDSRGNVIKALHKGIDSMEYHPVSNMLQKVKMVDGKTVDFYYDSKGERILKRLKNAKGEVQKEIHYLRDDTGRSLVERELTHVSANQPPAVLITMYVYGPNGLVGFIRRDQFYSVLTDHQGSVRLIVRDGEIVAAYDYLPYGNIMRKYGADPEAHISYRYTGQEWDEEIGLYNYHVRFYDPSIGRFYQTDPKEQYFSPYKYAGNSPISLIDPSGEIAFLALLPFIFMAVGAYAGGAAANNEWNFTKWDYTHPKTYVGVFFGGLTGYFLPGGFAASVSILTGLGLSTAAAVAVTASIGLTMSYLSAASANQSWNPADWDITSPITYSALFDGFAMGSSGIAGIRNIGMFYKQLNSVGKVAFIGGSIASTTGLFVMGGIVTEWKIDKPQFWFATISSVMAGPELTMFLSRPVSALTRIKNIREMRPTMRSTVTTLFKATIIVGSTTLLAAALNNGFTNWNMTDVSTYQSLLTAIQMGGSSVRFGKYDRIAAKKKLELRSAQKKEAFTSKVAKMTTDLYEKILDAGVLTPDAHYSPQSNDDIRAKKIPNTGVTVIVKENFAIAAFSSNKAPGIFVLYDHDNLNNPSYRSLHIAKRNNIIGTEEISIRQDSTLSERIQRSVDDYQNTIRAQNREEYNNENVLNRVADVAHTDPSIPEDTRNQVVNTIDEAMRTTGSIKEDAILRRIRQLNFENDVILAKKAIENDAIALVNDIGNDLKRRMPIEERRRLQQSKNNAVEAKKAASTDYRTTVTKEQAAYAKKLYEPLQHFDERLTDWQITNCAEAHAIQALERRNLIFQPNTGDLKYSDPQLDIEYMATYKTRGSPEGLTPYQRCDHCMINTALVQNVLTDPVWLHQFQEAYRTASEITDIKRPIFNPIINLQKTIKEEDKRKHKEKNQGKLFKRSIPDSQFERHSQRWYARPISWMKSLLLNNSSKTQGNPTEDHSIPRMNASEILSNMDVNGTLLLTDLVLAKCQGRKLYQVQNDVASQPPSTAELLCNIVQLFEDTVDEAARQSGISSNEINLDSFTLQQEVMTLLRKRQFDDLSNAITKHATKVVDAVDPRIPQKVIEAFEDKLANINWDRLIDDMAVTMKQATATNGVDMMAYGGRFDQNNFTETFNRKLGLPMFKEPVGLLH